MQRIIIKHLSGSKSPQIETFPTTCFRELVIGREPSAEIKYDPDRDDLVSRRHAKIIHDADRTQFLIHDLNSSNGTYVNHRKINGTVRIVPGDIIQLGHGGPELQFDLDPSQLNASNLNSAPPPKTAIDSLGSANCPKCEAQIDGRNNFCGQCGGVISQSPSTIRNDSAAVARLIDAIELTVRNAPIAEQLEAYSLFLTTESPLDEMAMAWAFKMRCYAQSGQLPEAQDSRRRARQCYATHLNLQGEVLEKYLADTSYMDGDIGLSDAEEHPWIYDLFKFGSPFSSSPYMMQGDSDEVRNNHAMRAWTFFGDDKDELLKILGVLSMRAGRYKKASEIFESTLRRPDFQGSEIRAEMYVGMVWMNFLLGECYNALGDRGRAINKWQQTRTFEFWREGQPEAFDILASGWVKKAKDALVHREITPPTLEDSRLAATHLASTWQWMLRAEAEMQGLDMYQFGTLLKNPENNFNRCTVMAERELQIVERYDPFARALVLAADGETRVWIHYDMVKGSVLHYRSFIHLGVDDFDPAIAALRKSQEIWPSLGNYLYLGFAYLGKGAVNEARKLFQLCINHAAELANFMEDEQEREGCIQIATILMSELPSINSLYISRNGQRHGPYKIEHIKTWLTSGQIQASDLAWYEGASNWMPLSSIIDVGNV